YGKRSVVEPGEVPNDAMLAVEETEIWPEDTGEEDVAIAAAQGRKSVIVHKVAAGESLASIAEKYGVSPADIKKGNNLRRNAVRVGQQLRISTAMPGEATLADARNTNTAHAKTQTTSKKATTANNSSQKSATTKKAKASGPVTHKIRNGESLSTISKKYGVSVEAIKKANGMTNDKLRAGKSLTIPAKSSSAKKSSAKKSKRKSRKR
ncbi:MAG: LysM peptidoglycan-binding domain-containing protein, partial [Muribaculaceae bacterium]|nr:LysM peptidoglycan-binding domain-containing protein [Muribaculaceae bacterium]